MENLLFLRIEIFIFFLSLFYIVYYIGQKVWNVYFKVKSIVNPLSIEEKKSSLNRLDLGKKGTGDLNEYKKQKLTKEQKEHLLDIVKRVEDFESRGYFDSAKHLIIEGLAIDKYSKGLNLALASIYEKERNYKHAKYIYKDLREVYPNDIDVLKKLAYLYAVKKNFEKALSIYEAIYKKKPTDEENIIILCDLTYEMEKYKSALKYINRYLRNHPRDLDKLLLKAICFEKTGKQAEALEVYKGVEELQPYDGNIKKKIEELSKDEKN